MRIRDWSSDVCSSDLAAQDRTGDLLRAIATLIGVALEFLDPFQVDDRRDADQQIRVRGDIDLITDERAMQPFIKQQVRIRRQALPLGKGSGRLYGLRRLVVAMQVVTDHPGAALALLDRKRTRLTSSD